MNEEREERIASALSWISGRLRELEVRFQVVGELRGAGGILSKIFDVQRARFSTVTCTRCQYTEMYRADSSLLGDVFDFFTQ